MFFFFFLYKHLAIKCHWTQRAAVIGDVIRVYSGHQGRTIIFCETKKEAQELSQNSAIKQVGPSPCASKAGDINKSSPWA